ncbi:MAG: acetyl-CoA carboxylase biotin carboxylase subunit [Flavobacteriales bacterium]
MKSQTTMRPITSILIANRGEIASRVIRTCRKMGIKAIAVYSEADRNAPFVAQADEAVFLGGSAPTESYLDMDKVIAAAKRCGADAIHPGYGFLSENAAFAERCAKEGIVFIGPHPGAISAMGSKSEAKTLMMKAGVPVVPGYQGEDQSTERLSKEATAMGFPVLLKATAGGGGKGMRIVHQEAGLKAGIDSAKREAKSAFGDDELIVEKYIASGRHIEFQIFGDQHGNAIHLLERECTLQRRYQKVIEESPSPVMGEDLRSRMGEVAVNAAKALRYDNAGTVEFIYDDKSGDFYFLEVNTRLQVEHPVTEEITGLDLVQMQIESAQGMPLRVKQQDVKGNGYAIECRLYAEDAANDFMPVTGTVERFSWPAVEGLRVETAVESGSAITVHYDPMIAKLVVWGEDRATAQRRMAYVLRQLVCLGTTTNQAFLLKLLEHHEFQEGKYDTHFIRDRFEATSLEATEEQLHLASVAATLKAWQQRENGRTLLRTLPSGWRNSFYTHQQVDFSHGDLNWSVKYRALNEGFEFLLGETIHTVKLQNTSGDEVRFELDGVQHRMQVVSRGLEHFIHSERTGPLRIVEQDRFPLKEVERVKGGYTAPIPSQVVKVLVTKGQSVKPGDGLLVLSSMKMESTVSASEEGVVEEVYAAEGSSVEAGSLLLKLNT